jgi:cytochrome c556
MNDKHLLLLAITIMTVFLASYAPQQVNADVSVKKNMLEVTVPASNIVFAVANTDPKNLQDWQEVKRSALKLIESGKLLLKNKKTEPVWQQSAKTLLTAANAVVKAADASDVEAVTNAGNDLYAACESCHASYLKKSNSKSH